MQTQVSSISQLDPISTLASKDLFIVSTPVTDSTSTGFKTVKITMEDFQKYLSGYISQAMSTEISNIAGNVYSNQNVINTIRGSLQQTINNYIHDITGDVSVIISNLNMVSGDLSQQISVNIQDITGNVTAIDDIQNFITTEYAQVSAEIVENIRNVSGDIYNQNGISNNITAISSYISSTIDSYIASISGSVFSDNSISTALDALSAYVNNEIKNVIDRVSGDVYSDNSLISQVSSLSSTVVNNVNDLATLKRVSRYPIVHIDINDDGSTVEHMVMRDRHVNVVTLDDGVQKYLYIEKNDIGKAEDSNGERLSRDFILYLRVNKGLESVEANLVLWDGDVIYTGPDDESIFTDLVPGTDYIYYFSEIDDDTFYVSRQEIEYIKAPAAPEDARPAYQSGEGAPD